MANSLFKVGRSGVNLEVLDNAGALEVQVNGVKVLGPQQSAVASLTNSTGGTADGTLAAVPSDTLANAAAACNNNFSDVNAKLDAILTALRNQGLIAT